MKNVYDLEEKLRIFEDEKLLDFTCDKKHSLMRFTRGILPLKESFCCAKCKLNGLQLQQFWWRCNICKFNICQTCTQCLFGHLMYKTREVPPFVDKKRKEVECDKCLSAIKVSPASIFEEDRSYYWWRCDKRCNYNVCRDCLS